MLSSMPSFLNPPTVREGNVDTNDWKEIRNILLLVLVNVSTIFQYLLNGLDYGDELTKISPELLDINILE